MRTVPGVIVDRVNVAGSESGQQSNVFSKGADAKDTTWSLDGVVITFFFNDTATTDIYTFDTFDEVSRQDGRHDVRVATGRPGHRPRHQARDQQFPRVRRHQLRSRRPPVVEPAGRATWRPAPPGQRQGRPYGPDQRLRLRHRRPHPEGQALVLRQLRQERHSRAPAEPDPGQDAAHQLQRQAELAGRAFRHDQRLLVPRRQDEGGAPRRQRVAQALEGTPGTRGRHLFRASRLQRWSGTTSGPALLQPEGRLLQPGLLPVLQGSRTSSSS